MLLLKPLSAGLVELSKLSRVLVDFFINFGQKLINSFLSMTIVRTFTMFYMSQMFEINLRMCTLNSFSTGGWIISTTALENVKNLVGEH